MQDSSQIEIAPLKSVVKVRPMLMLTGFLGAGKTTLLRELLEHLATRKILSDVILNDRENAYLDKTTLKDQAAEITALTGACVCCDGFHDLVEMILKASKSKHEILLIELNGTSDPSPLQESFTLLESKFCLRPRWQVCVIDARHFRKRRRYNDLESLQLETASHYYISWTSELSDQEEIELEGEIKAINSGASRTSAKILADALAKSLEKSHRHTLASQKSTKKQLLPSAFDLNPQPKELDDRHQLAHEFTGCQIIIPEPIEASRIKGWLERLPESVIRAKALLTLSTDIDRRYLYERVGQTISPDPISAQTNNTKAPCSAIFIGAELDPKELLQLTREYLHSECHFPEP